MDKTLELIAISDNAKACTTLRDPFEKQNFDKMIIVVHNDRDMKFYNLLRCTGTIYFKNGPTAGSHDIEADSLPALNDKIVAFVKELEEKKK